MVSLSHTTFVPDIFLAGCFKILFAVSIPALRKKKHYCRHHTHIVKKHGVTAKNTMRYHVLG